MSGVSVVSTSQLLHTWVENYAIIIVTQNTSTPIQIEQLLLCHGDQTHIIFRVATGFGVTNYINCILLGLEPGGQKVTIAHVLTVVHTTKK